MKLYVSSSVGIGKEQEIEVDPVETIERVREKVGTVQAIDPNAITLVFNGETLPLDHTVKNCGLKDGSKIVAMPRNPEGGSSPVFLSPVMKARLETERRRLTEKSIDLKQVDPARNPLLWRGSVRGQGAYAGRRYRIEVTLPSNYPARPPRVKFIDLPNPPHPNISAGGVCFNHLNQSWDPTMTLASVHAGLEWLLANPNFHSVIQLPLRLARRPTLLRLIQDAF